MPHGIRLENPLPNDGSGHERSVDGRVIDPRTLKPLDSETILHSVAKTGREFARPLTNGSIYGQLNSPGRSRTL
jgi:hypothetical protein